MLVAVLWKAALQPISMKNIELHKNKTFDFTSKTDDLEKKSKISKNFFEIINSSPFNNDIDSDRDLLQENLKLKAEIEELKEKKRLAILHQDENVV